MDRRLAESTHIVGGRGCTRSTGVVAVPRPSAACRAPYIVRVAGGAAHLAHQPERERPDEPSVYNGGAVITPQPRLSARC
jgi:hypothetical protein